MGDQVKTDNLAVCILGMHRSGTSCLAGCLEERGLYLGDVDNGSRFNVKGNKENEEFRLLNEDILIANGGNWGKIPEQITWTDEHRRRRDALIEGYAAVEAWGFKDPRAVLTLPFWTEALPDLRFIGTFRHPSAVVVSLSRRKKMMPETAPLDLWVAYNRRVLAQADQYDVPMVCFDWDADVYAKAVNKAASDVGLGPAEGLDFFDETIRTSNLSKEEAVNVGSEAMALYDELMARANAFYGTV